MILSIVTTDSILQRREFFCQLNTLETGFELLSKLTAQGHALLKAHLIEKGKVIDLPVEAFDGSPFQEPIQQLENQWIALLETVKTEATQKLLTTNSIKMQKLVFCEEQIVALEGRITRTYQFLDKQQSSFTAYNEKNTLFDNYRIILENYQRQLNKAWQIRQQLLDCIY
ncbi:hypothetical protein [Spirosoma jeollabukense]